MFGRIRALRAARRAARGGDWAGAEQAYSVVVKGVFSKAAHWVQYGHALNEQRRHADAVEAYREAVERQPNSADAWLHLGHALRLTSDREGAIAAYVRSVELDPDPMRAVREMLAYGARASLPDLMQTRMENGLHGERAFSRQRYDAYRAAYQTPMPPAQPTAQGQTVIIDARQAMPAAVKATLAGLSMQTWDQWQAFVVASPDLLSHSVASMASVDARIMFVTPDEAVGEAIGRQPVVLADAGTVFEPPCLAWLDYALFVKGGVAVYGDHDEAILNGDMTLSFRSPHFQPMFDSYWFADDAAAPAVVGLAAGQVRSFRTWGDMPSRGEALQEASCAGPVVAAPVLTSYVRTDLHPVRIAPVPVIETPSAGSSRICVVIQTRDEAVMLSRCVRSLKRRAAHPELLDILIVDNGSRERATRNLLRRWGKRGLARILPLAGPFNWSLANNLAAEECPNPPILLFLNNDTRMLSDRWDVTLQTLLSDRGVGAVGALLRYEDGSIQHAGIVMSITGGGPVHEGVGAAVDDEGPDARWRRTRRTAAVTGAFLAVRRDDFLAVGGFDVLDLPIAFNDVDFCLKLRTRGLAIIQSADIQMIHYESATRGLHLSPAQLAWDREEYHMLRKRWEGALDFDPAYNPNWIAHGRPFDGYRFPTLPEILSRIAQSAGRDPWSPTSMSANAAALEHMADR